MIGWEYGGKFCGLIEGSTEKMIEEIEGNHEKLHSE
jgi:hypothetical protein